MAAGFRPLGTTVRTLWYRQLDLHYCPYICSFYNNIRFTSVRVTAKYHGIKLEYREHQHTVLDLLGQIRAKLCIWKRPYISPEAVRVLLQEWNVSLISAPLMSF